MSSNTQSSNKKASAVSAAIPGAGWTNGDLAPYTRAGKLQMYQSHRRWIGLDDGGWTRIGDGDPLDARHVTSSSSARNENEQSTNRASAAAVRATPSSKPPPSPPTSSPYDPQAASVRALIAQLCERFYQQNWATGTGGGVCIRVKRRSSEAEDATTNTSASPSNNNNKDDASSWRVFVAPSGIQKEDMIGDDVFELDMDRQIVQAPRTPHLKQSACTPLWYQVFQHRPQAQCVIHTHSLWAQLATLLDPTEQSTVLRLTHLEMLKGVGGHAYDDVLEIPIIDNRPTEDMLADDLQTAIVQYPNCNAVLVRRHGVYVWGDSWQQAKTQCESFDYLFQTAVQMKQWLGVDPGALPKAGSYRENHHKSSSSSAASPEDDGSSHLPPASKKAKTEHPSNAFNGQSAASNEYDCQSNTIPILPRDAKILLLDIEGCTTSISFVKDVLFPYVTNHIEEYVLKYIGNDDCSCLHSQLLRQCRGPLPKEHAKWKLWDLVRYMVAQDIKSPSLKRLQGKMWQQGYETGQFQGHVYSDVLPMLLWAQQKNVRVYIYSSGSVQAQQLLFQHSVSGNLLPYIQGHFDISTAGPKKEACSYRNIAETLQVDPSEIVFCSDAEPELFAAREAKVGHVIMSIRPGNVPLTKVAAGKEEFPAIYSLLQLCGE
jgi:methylthioribulose 1-phosphate dehydratase/enolase-phosphatase E1